MIKEKVIIFGASTLGEIAYKLLKDKYDICYFSDNDMDKWNSSFCGISIIEPIELVKLKKYKIIIASVYSMEIAYQLFDMNLNQIKVFRCNNIENTSKIDSYILNDAFSREEFNYIKERFALNPVFNKKITKNMKRVSENKDRKKNILMISYSFPPIGRSGVQRSLKFAKYLYELGWTPIVVTTDKMSLPYDKDYSLLKEVPNDIQVIRINHTKFSPEELNKNEIGEILQLQCGLLDDNLYFQYIKKLRDNFYNERKLLISPDEVIIWTNKVLREIFNLVDINDIDVVYTTSSPYSDHIIGYYLKKELGVPWVADFRDEWTNDIELNLDRNSFSYKLQRNMEEKIVQLADKVLTVTPLHGLNYINSFQLLPNEVCTITNGYDEDDFINIQTKNKCKNKKFTIVYNGTLYYKINPYTVVFALNELINRDLIDKTKIELHFTGYCEQIIKRNACKYDLYNICRFNEYIDHEESLSRASNADVLLLILGSDERYKAVYTGKVFEYLRLYKPIIALTPKESVVEKLLIETNSGVNIEYDNIKEISLNILNFYNAWLEGKDLYKPNKEFIRKYNRKNLTKKLISVFDSVLYKK